MPARVCGGEWGDLQPRPLRSDLEWGLLFRRLFGNPRLMIMVSLSLVTAPRWIAEELRTNILPPLRIQELQFSRLFFPVSRASSVSRVFPPQLSWRRRPPASSSPASRSPSRATDSTPAFYGRRVLKEDNFAY